MELLPTELLLVIIDHIILDQASLASCNRLNRRWHYLTRGLLYKKPKLHRQSAFSTFLRTVDTPEMSQHLHSISDKGCSNTQMIYHASISPLSSISTSSKVHPDILSTRKASAARSPAKPTNIFPTIALKSIPPGMLVEIVDLSMMPHRWETVNFGLIQSLTQGCPFVSTLNLSDCALIRDSAVQVIAEQLGPRQLRSLILSGCSKITDLAVLSLCAHAVRLENLELSGCDRISDISVLELGSAIVHMTDSVTDTSITIPSVLDKEDISDIEFTPSLQGISRSIKSLDLSFCTRITDTGIKGLQMGATQLTYLCLEGCYGVLMSDDGLDVNEWEDLDSEDDGILGSDLDLDSFGDI